MLKPAITKSLQSINGFKEDFLYRYCSKNNGSIKPKSILILSATGGGNAYGLSFPYRYFRKELRQELNLYTKEITSNSLEEKKQCIDSFKGDIIILSLPLRGDDGEILSKKVVKDFFLDIPQKSREKIIFFTPSDNPISPYFDILPLVKLYMLPFTLKKPEEYERTYKGGSQLAHAMSDIYDIDPIPENEYRDELFSSQAESQYLDKLTTSWNFTHWKRLIKLFDSHNKKCLPHQSNRPIDVSCRFNQYIGWCKRHRMESYNALQAMSKRYNIVASCDKVDIKQYFREIENSKILFSPFGWGEICPKEYEAIIKGCLVIKPSVEHINIFPNVLIPNETYVPVKWDLSDLKEKIEY